MHNSSKQISCKINQTLLVRWRPQINIPCQEQKTLYEVRIVLLTLLILAESWPDIKLIYSLAQQKVLCNSVGGYLDIKFEALWQKSMVHIYKSMFHPLHIISIFLHQNWIFIIKIITIIILFSCRCSSITC